MLPCYQLKKIKKITPENLPPLTILTGDDLGQFELLKDEFEVIHYDPADLNVTLFGHERKRLMQMWNWI